MSWSVCLDAVAAGGLCLVDGGVGAGQQLVQVDRSVFGLVVSEADGHGDLQAVHDVQGADGSPEAVGDLLRGAEVEAVENDDELLAALTAEPVVAA